MRARWLVLVCVAWFGLWCLTPGLLEHGPARLISQDEATVVLLESLLAFVLAIVILLLHRRFRRALFAPSKQVLLYAIPTALAAVLPLHYSFDLPVLLYLFWTAVSVFWQDYLTFGLLQSHLRALLPARWAVPLVAVLFTAGHAILIPERFAPPHVLAALGILALGLVLASIREKLTTMHLILVLHLSFYFAAA